MVSAELLDLVDLILQYVHKNTNPFGGVKLIAIGDFLQLKPVENDDANIRYIGRLYAFDSYV
ncbi:hypothetical protein FACS189459_2990 [Bacilli bacterium]|nr:hypothetical protein FACS189459_2990 [Bacilli bacterium]GHU51696.1 hypothetical protein FACS189496_0440 [Bacilli bacterium]